MIKQIRTAAIAAGILIGCISCGDVVRDNRSPVIVNVASLSPAALLSDVVKNLTTPAPCSTTAPCPTTVNDTATAVISSSMKNISIAPTPNNQVTIHRYHVEFRRADGRNIEGVDVPQSFDGAVTATITGGGSQSVGFELVRHVAKEESPLIQLRNNANIINTIAVVTFYGTDAVGNAVSAQGQMSVNFGNFSDQ
jgi:hypothetical protein